MRHAICIFIIDGGLESLLCAVFEWFERKPGKVMLRLADRYQPDAFGQVFTVDRDEKKAGRVWAGLQRKLSPAWRRKFYAAFLSELPEMYQALFDFACTIFQSPEAAENNYGDPNVLSVSKTAKMVEREKHRMEAFIRFQHSADGLYYCGIEPDFNVIPLIVKHFRDRYADQRWLIYDLKRHYGVWCEDGLPEQVSFEREMYDRMTRPGEAQLSLTETAYAGLWKGYFNSTNIPARKNTKLHLRHVPKRYWKYLTEKQ
ncbi:TIGR03915 family putative DNA repair protein [Pedobacter deserti]|uniref:TIGR03915 family putative DNA repair protein n=1 Tax=Pedobacter deserti TaxID=2817382 RepID=UPI00210D5BA5|nr:TIGR03915 family putative DNA repair protein [Pedobacter sp. SYSU D00382]